MYGYIFYLLSIQVFIVFLRRRFILFTRLVGKNVVSVMATVLLLSYSPILNTCYFSLNHKNLYYTDSNTSSQLRLKVLWYSNGNIPYLSLKHVPLFVLGLILFFALTCFTLLLLLIQCLQRSSNILCLRWIFRLKPFFEAYTGPCNDNYRFWPGFLLLLRVVLFFGVRVDSRELISLPAFFLIMMSLGCVSPRGIYKKWKLNVLEFLLFLNINITTLLLAIEDISTSRQRIAPKRLIVYLSITFTMVLFIGILLYHVYQRIKGTRGWKMVVKFIFGCTSILPVSEKALNAVKTTMNMNPFCPSLFLQWLK